MSLILNEIGIQGTKMTEYRLAKNGLGEWFVQIQRTVNGHPTRWEDIRGPGKEPDMRVVLAELRENEQHFDKLRQRIPV
jgi:hypothetical protein